MFVWQSPLKLPTSLCIADVRACVHAYVRYIKLGKLIALY